MIDAVRRAAMQPTQDINIRELVPLVAPRQLKAERPMSEAANRTVIETREQVKQILDGRDRRLLIVMGPCSIHDPKAALEYAEKLQPLADRVADQLLLVMRVYFEKPRTTLGWKGLINDPHLDDTFDVECGLRTAREILLAVTELGLATATEVLEPITPQYIADLITLASIGARTTESPTHRQMASGLSMPVGYKNGTDGSLQVAVDAMLAARGAHSFVGIDGDGKTSVIHTVGNPWGFLILRGGRSGPNYLSETITSASEQLIASGLSPRLLVDCSHANSDKDYRKQAGVWQNVIEQRIAGNDAIVGLMLESNLNPGKQALTTPAELQYGVSITDGCIGWDETEALVLDAHKRLAQAGVTAAI